ncbi:MAG: hypothetical protein OEW39_01215, partial [Deltaproteobacteria bacterium]|nr:hypothetical protein [Deltaproteobacteria bacterium]
MRWYLYLDAPGSGPHNMAKDAFFLEHAVVTGIPTLRLYQWEPMTLSVGRTQKIEREVNLDACREAGVPLVRRSTGGRAVLHGQDLTYSVTAPLVEPFQGGIMQVYQKLSGVFVRFFQELGLEPQVQAYT